MKLIVLRLKLSCLTAISMSKKEKKEKLLSEVEIEIIKLQETLVYVYICTEYKRTKKKTRRKD